MSIRFSMQSIFFNNVPTDHTKECMIYLIESASSLDTNYSISFLSRHWDFRFCRFAKCFSSAFRFLHCIFWWLVQFAGFSTLVFGFRVFDKNDGGCSNFPVQCNLQFFWLCQGGPSPDVVLLLLGPTKFRNQVLHDSGTAASQTSCFCCANKIHK